MPRGTSFSRAAPRARPTAAPPSATACRVLTTPRPWASTSSTSRPSTRSARRTARAQQLAPRRARRTRSPLRHRQPPPRRQRRRPQGRRPELGTLEDLSWLIGEVKKARHGDRHRLRDQLLARPSLCREPPRVVLQASRRHHQVRREPAEEVRGRLPAEFPQRQLAGLWQEMRDVIAFWCEIGIRTFRVDIPTRSPSPSGSTSSATSTRLPDAIFLSEAFTRPKMMQVLAKVGFTQSYTYFTWRNTKWELSEYLTELTQTEMKDYFRGNFFTNTPTSSPSTSSAADAWLPHPRLPRRHALARLRHLQRIRALRKRPHRARRSTSTPRNTSSRAATGTPPATSRTTSPAQRHPPRQPRSPGIRQPALPPRRQRQHPLLQQEDRRRGQRPPLHRHRRPLQPADRLRARPLEELGNRRPRDVSSGGPANRRTLHLDRFPQLRLPQPPHPPRPHPPPPPLGGREGGKDVYL